jgi:tetratricopeptide (TPR) repeat protein
MIFKWTLVAAICFGIGWRLLAALFEKELALWEAMVLFSCLFAFAGLAIRLAESNLFYPFLLLAGLVIAAVRYYPQILEEKRRRSIIAEDLQRCRQALDFDPLNVAAYSLMGDIYMRLGELDEAIANYRKAIELDPKASAEQDKLDGAMREKAMLEGKAMFCPRCLAPRPKETNVCQNCARPFSFDETISANFRGLPQGERYRYIAELVGAGILLLVFLLFAPAWLTLLIFLGLCGYAMGALRRLSKW